MSFTDLMSSERGPGLIGMMMGLFVLLGFGILFMFAFDEGSQGGDRSIESVIRHQTKEIDAYQANIELGKLKLDQAPARIAQGRELTRLKRGGQEAIINLTKGIEKRSAAIALQEAAFGDYKDQYRAHVRGKAKGQTIGKLETLKRVVYNDVVIREVNPVGIQIRHADGHKRIPFEDLPETMKDHFQFDPQQKEQALAGESASMNELEAAVVVTNSIVDQANAERRSADAELVREKTIRAISSKESRIQALGREIDSLNNSIREEERKPISKAPGMRFKVVDNGRAIIELRSQIATLRSRL